MGFWAPRMYLGPRKVPSRPIRMPVVKTHRPFSFAKHSMALLHPLCSAQPAFPARRVPLERTMCELNARCVSPTHLVHAPNVRPINTSCVQPTQPAFKRHNVRPINTSCVQLTQPAFNLPSQAPRASCSTRSSTEMVKMACEPPRWLCQLGLSRANLIRTMPSRPIWSQLGDI